MGYLGYLGAQLRQACLLTALLQSANVDLALELRSSLTLQATRVGRVQVPESENTVKELPFRSRLWLVPPLEQLILVGGAKVLLPRRDMKPDVKEVPVAVHRDESLPPFILLEAVVAVAIMLEGLRWQSTTHPARPDTA